MPEHPSFTVKYCIEFSSYPFHTLHSLPRVSANFPYPNVTSVMPGT